MDLFSVKTIQLKCNYSVLPGLVAVPGSPIAAYHRYNNIYITMLPSYLFLWTQVRQQSYCKGDIFNFAVIMVTLINKILVSKT